MTLYLDTSDLVKLFVAEPGSALVRETLEAAVAAATSRVAWVEVCAALARKRRDGTLTSRNHAAALAAFRRQWGRFLVMEVSPEVAELAGELSDRHGLRGYDAIHLASARILAEHLKAPVRFLTADVSLKSAADAEGLG
ncbi:MAG: type II toxin-antitoxin system VapC family toxin [Planctomycetota bacterium]